MPHNVLVPGIGYCTVLGKQIRDFPPYLGRVTHQYPYPSCPVLLIQCLPHGVEDNHVVLLLPKTHLLCKLFLIHLIGGPFNRPRFISALSRDVPLPLAATQLKIALLISLSLKTEFKFLTLPLTYSLSSHSTSWAPFPHLPNRIVNFSSRLLGGENEARQYECFVKWI